MKHTLQKILDAGYERVCGNDTTEIFQRITNGSRVALIYNSDEDKIIDMIKEKYTKDMPTTIYDDGGVK